jgi:hypothetical protein
MWREVVGQGCVSLPCCVSLRGLRLYLRNVLSRYCGTVFLNMFSTEHVTQNAIQTLNMSTAPLSLLLSAELNHSIVRHRVQNGSTEHVIQNAIRWHRVQNAN